MTMTTAVTWLLSISALLLSIAALIVSLRSSARSQSRRLNEHSDRFSVLDDHLGAVDSRLKSLQARINAANWSRKANNEVPELTSGTTEAEKDAWTRETNLKIARGEIRPVRFTR
jgi:hypothetical protein